MNLFSASLSDTLLLQHQSDPRHRSNFIPTRGQNDDTNRVNLAARTSLGRCDRSSRTAGRKVASVGLTGAGSQMTSKDPVYRTDRRSSRRI